MANLKALGRFIYSLQGDRLFNTGVVGSTSQIQHQTDELKKAFAQFQAQRGNQETQSNFKSALLSAHLVTAITDIGLAQCEEWLEEN